MATVTGWNDKSHLDVMAEIKGALNTILRDPLLSDTGPAITSEEIGATIALLRGQALTLQLRFFDGQTICN